MTADVRIFCHDGDQFIRKILGMGCHKTHTVQPVDLRDLPQELGKAAGLVLRQPLPVGIDILSQQHDFPHAVPDQIADLTENFLRLPAVLPSSDIGNNAVRAEVVAAVHDVYAGLKEIFPVCRKFFDHLIGFLQDIHHHALILKDTIQKLCQLIHVVGSENQINKAEALLQAVHHLLLLHHAAAQADNHMGVPVLQGVQIAQAAVDPGIGVFPYRAGIIENQVSLLFVRVPVTDFFQNTP